MSREMNACGRCHHEARHPEVRLSLVNRAREAVRDGQQHTGPDYAHEYRCIDREACEQRRTRQGGQR